MYALKDNFFEEKKSKKLNQSRYSDNWWDETKMIDGARSTILCNKGFQPLFVTRKPEVSWMVIIIQTPRHFLGLTDERLAEEL